MARSERRAWVAVVAFMGAGGCAAPSGVIDGQVDGLRESSDDEREALPIIGGTEATAYSEAVMLNMSVNGQPTGSCSGSLIAPTVVLTAGHCVVSVNGWEAVAPYANPGQSASSSNGYAFDYTDTGDTVDPDQHDLAVVILDTPINLAEFPQLAQTKLADGEKVINVGRIDNGQISYTALFEGPEVAIYDGAQIGFPFDYGSNEISQPGDSGGPVYQPGTSPRLIVGVNSGGGGGSQITARADLLYDWLQEQIANPGGGNNPNPPPPPPPPPPSGTCDHDPLVTGAALDPSCSSCASLVCSVDNFCCTSEWDDICVMEAASFCGGSCPGGGSCPSETCPGGLTYEGECNGTQLSWCEGGSPSGVDCAAFGLTCQWNGSASFYDCM